MSSLILVCQVTTSIAAIIFLGGAMGLAHSAWTSIIPGNSIKCSLLSIARALIALVLVLIVRTL